MATNKPPARGKTPQKQRDGRDPVVDNPRLPLMEAVNPRRIGRQIVTMAEDPEPSEVKKNVMKPVPKRRLRAPKAESLGDQVPATGAAAAEEGPGYIALRLRSEGGELQVQGAKFVAGPLLTAESVSPGLTYDAKIGRRRVAHGDVPDSVEWRSHPDPEGREGREGHHVVEQTSFAFTVRIPADQVEKRSLEDLRVTLYRWRGKGPGEHIAISDLPKQPKRALQTLATLQGLPMKDLSKSLQRDVRRVLDQAAP